MFRAAALRRFEYVVCSITEWLMEGWSIYNSATTRMFEDVVCSTTEWLIVRYSLHENLSPSC